MSQSAEVVKDEQLETKARELAQSVLATAAAKADKEIAVAERDASLMREEIIANRRGFRAYAAFWCGQGVRISVEVYAKLSEVVAGVVSGVFGNKGKKPE